MVGHHRFTRVNTLEQKEHIFRKVGRQRAEKYFDLLKRFLSSKLSKTQFDRSCIQTLGRENVSLNDKLIMSILKNAHKAKIPPQKPRKPEGLNVKLPNGYQKNPIQPIYRDSFPPSTRKCRSPINRKFRDRPSPLGPLGKSPSLASQETFTRTQEQVSATELHSIGSRPPALEEGEEVEQVSEILDVDVPEVPRWHLVTPPIGVSIGSIIGGPTKGFRGLSDFCFTCENNGGLPDTASLKSWLEKKVASEGLGVSVDCANLLNKGLDVFLKRLIEPAMGIARRGESGSNRMMSGYNGMVFPGRFGGIESQEGIINVSDFRAAMELNPRLLGEDWSVQLEKMCHYEMS